MQSLVIPFVLVAVHRSGGGAPGGGAPTGGGAAGAV